MTRNAGPVRIEVDIGGTFTDVAVETPAGLFTTKVLIRNCCVSWL